MSSSTHNVDTSSSTHPKSTRSNNPNSKKKKQKPSATEDSPNFCLRICNAIDEATEKAEKKRMERTGPKPWIERKFIVGVVIALFAWSSYDFLGQILRKCLQRKDNALVGFASGIVLTIFYSIFWIMFAVTYLKLIFTSPGFARDHVPKSEPPLPSDPPPELNLTKTNNNNASNNPNAYPPSDYRRSMEERITHNSISIDDHGEFDSPTVPRTAEGDSEADGSTTIGVPYSSMGPRRHKRSESGSNIAIPPTPRFPDTRTSTSSSPVTPTTPKQPAPALLRKNSNSKSSNPPSPSEQKPPNKLIRISSSSRYSSSSVPASPGIPNFSNTRKSESSREGALTPGGGVGGRKGGRPEALKASSGFRFDSTSTMDRSRVHSRTHSQSGTVYPPTTLPTPSMSAPQTPSTATPVPGIRISASANHPTVNLAGRTEPADEGEDMTDIRRDAGDEDLEQGRPDIYLDDLPPVQDKWQRRPSDQPVLDPYYRYCRRDEIVKPMRAHHCRICNTCVLGYDHHCPWVGQCVGARNRRFFVVFLFWSSFYTLYTFGILVATIVHEINPPSIRGTTLSGSVDGNLIALAIVTALFMVFTTGMFATHVHLLCRNASTVEWHGIQGMRERERAVISQAVPVCVCLGMDGEGHGGLLGTAGGEGEGKNPWQEEGLKGYKGRVELRKRFDGEWGQIGKEGNLWWLGSNRANWEAVMGKNPWTWFLPVGDTSNVGLVYPTNPRFDEHGRWMRRREWPAELQ